MNKFDKLTEAYLKVVNEWNGSHYTGANFDSEPNNSESVEAQNLAHKIVSGVYYWGAKGYENSGDVLRRSNPHIISKKRNEDVTRYVVELTLPFSVLQSNHESDEESESLTNKYSEDFRDGLRSYSGPGREYVRGSLEKVIPHKNNPDLGSFTVSLEIGRDV